jgi:CBS domain-containing protein
MKVKEILKTKGPEVFTVGDNKDLLQAATIMANNKIGVLLVLGSEGKISGILSERDILQESVKDPDNFKTMKVGSAMTKKVLIVEPEDDIEYVESIMTENRVRHLPVLQNKVLVGLISIGDVVKAALSGTRHENKYLLDYISGSLSK